MNRRELGLIRKKLIRAVGVRGTLKSVYYSLKYTSSLSKFVVGKRTATLIDAGAEFDIEDWFTVGFSTPHAVDPFGRSYLRVSDEGRVHTTGYHACIGCGSVLNIRGLFEMGNSYVSGNAQIYALEKVTIGDGCAIAWGVNILDNDGNHELTIDGETQPTSAPIEIGDDVWIGHHSSVHKGVTIGDGAVVASHSLVNDDVPPNTLVAGVPATVKSENVSWST